MMKGISDEGTCYELLKKQLSRNAWKLM